MKPDPQKAALRWELRKRLWLSWRFRVLPWQLPRGWRYLSRQRPTDADIARGEELAREHGWE